MNFVAIIIVAFLAINSALSSSALSENSNSPSKKYFTTEELGTCPKNSSISVKVFRNLKGEWLTTIVAGNKLRDFSPSMDLNLDKNVIECGDSRYIRISDFLKNTEPDNSTEAIVGGYRNYNDGDSNDSFKRINELTTIAEDNANQTRKTLQIMEQRMNSFEKTLNNNTETLINFEISQNNITESFINFERTQTSFQKTLTNMEQILNEMRVISNSTKNFETKDKEKATLIHKSSSTHVKESVTTAPSPVIIKAKAHMTFDRDYKGRNVPLSSDLRTAMRTRPTEDTGYFGGVVSYSPLEDDEIFQIRIDETIDRWRDDGIGFGVIIQKRDNIRNEWYIWGRVGGTWAIKSTYGAVSGRSSIYRNTGLITKDGYPLQTHNLTAGTILGVSRKSDGNLHFYLNGIDKGSAFRNVPKGVYAFVDVIRYVTKISIIS